MGSEKRTKADSAGKQKSWGGARPGAGRPAKQPGTRRLALSVTVADRHWVNVHIFAAQHGASASEVLDGMLAQAMQCEPYASFLEEWYRANTLESTLLHLANGRERVIPKHPGSQQLPEERP